MIEHAHDNVFMRYTSSKLYLQMFLNILDTEEYYFLTLTISLKAISNKRCDA